MSTWGVKKAAQYTNLESQLISHSIKLVISFMGFHVINFSTSDTLMIRVMMHITVDL